MKCNWKYYWLLLTVMISSSLWASSQPKLVVGITLDGYNANYLSLIWNELSAQGFKRIVKESCHLTNVTYPYQVAGNATDIATLCTGAHPFLHGITSENYFSREQAKFSLITEDASVTPWGTRAISAHRLLASTFTDELWETSLGLSKIVSIAIDPNASALMAGHAGAAFWMDNVNGQWASSSYYLPAMHEWAQQRSANDYLVQTWEPILPAGYYHAAGSKAKGFSYPLEKVCTGAHQYDHFATTPAANEMVYDMALNAIQALQLGRDEQVDVLNLQFSLQNFYQKEGQGLSIELEDAYLRLDKLMQLFLDYLDKQFGKENVLVFLTDTREQPMVAPFNQRLPRQSFCTYRYMALLNSYLMAHYGQAKWVLGFGDGHIYLNRKLIEEKNLSLQEMQRTAMDFMYMVPGVLQVYSSYQLQATYAAYQSLQVAYHPTQAGDLVFFLAPGWYEVDKNENPTGYRSDFRGTTSLFLWGWRMPVERIDTPVEAILLAPTMATWLSVSQPNASKGGLLPISLLPVE